jgi:hypothetical protein
MTHEQFVLNLILLFVAVPLVLGVGFEMFRRLLRFREKQLAAGRRVRVLERIATDKGAGLAAEIEGLHGREAERLPHHS